MASRPSVFVGAFAIGAAIAAAALAQSPSSQNSPSQNSPAPQPEYHPSFGDLMTFAVQPRHIKLGVSGHARNWSYAAYEASELRSAFARIGRTIPVYRKQALPDMFASTVLPSVDKLDAAIKAQDGAAFDRAYTEVTAACNRCHTALEHPFVVIREPSASPYADQDLGGDAGRKARRK